LGAKRGGIGRDNARFAALTMLALVAALIGPPATASGAPPSQPAAAITSTSGSPSASRIRDLGQGPDDRTQPSGRAYVPGVVLVGFRGDTSAAQRVAARRTVKAQRHRAVSELAPGLERLELEPGASVESAVRALRARPGVRFAEPDYLFTVDHLPNEDIYTAGDLWGMSSNLVWPYGTEYGAAASAAWEQRHLGSRDVYIGILDTGVDISHKDLAPNIWTNPFDTSGNGLDDDGNGYVDDLHGWDFFHDDGSVYDSVASDFHGTHVAGTIGAAGNNEEGVVGVNWAVTMIPLKFIDGEGAVSDAVAALDYLTDLKTRHGLNIVATNNSWGGEEQSSALEDAINRGGDAGILFVAAAGNEGVDTDAAPVYPASHTCDTRADNGQPRGYDCLISVAAITETGGLATFSNYGATTVDIGAPGQTIASTYPGNDYVYLNGTSMAAPHVTGALALLASCQTAPSANGLEAQLYAQAIPTPSLEGMTTTGGRLNAGAMTGGGCDYGGPPRAVITAFAGGTDAPAEFWVLYSEQVTGIEAADFILGGTSTGWSVGPITVYTDAAFVRVTATSPPVGTLSLTVAADSVTGANEAGPTAPVAITTLVDRAAPTVTAPVSSIRSGVPLNGSAIPLRLTWTASDAETGARFYWVQYSTNGGSSWFDLSTQFPYKTMDVLVSPSGSMRFRILAYDWAGHASAAFATGPTFSPRLSQESSSAITYSGAWFLSRYTSFSGGAARYTSVGKRSATYSFSARAVAFVTTLAPSRGVAKIWLDGVLVARIDLGRSPTAFRRIVWTRTFTSVGTHKVKVSVVGGYGRVDVDAFAVLR
jgi:subtilisin family serine protease